MILVFKSQEELIKAFIKEGGNLNGYIPAKMIDSSKLEYPIQIEVDEKMKTFWLYEEPKVKVAEAPKKAKKRLSKGAIIGISVGSVCAILIIMLGLVFGLSGCASKSRKCVEYDESGNYCKAEEVVYQKRR